MRSLKRKSPEHYGSAMGDGAAPAIGLHDLVVDLDFLSAFHPRCPECGFLMKLRLKRGGKVPFWGCCNQPWCKITRPYQNQQIRLSVSRVEELAGRPLFDFFSSSDSNLREWIVRSAAEKTPTDPA
jgi:hypothetical protein